MKIATEVGDSIVSAVILAATQSAADVVAKLGTSPTQGLAGTEVERRKLIVGPNAIASHQTRLLLVLWRQLRSPLLALLVIAATASYFVGERSDAAIIGLIVAVSVGLGFVNEYRAEIAAEALHSQIRHETLVIRDGLASMIDVAALVPGDLIEIRLGDVVPADVRLIDVVGLTCGESLLTGESLHVEKNVVAVASKPLLAELSPCALMGTVVTSGSARAVVVSTGSATEFGKIAAGLNTGQTETEFQLGLRHFSMLLVYVAGTLTVSIFVVNLVQRRPLIDALLFSLAIAVGITPQLLPAVVATSLAAGSRRLSQQNVLVKRLVCIEDLGNVDTLFTDKTGTLTQGRINFMRALGFGSDGHDQPGDVVRWGLLCNDTTGQPGPDVGGNPLDAALRESPAAVAEQVAAADYTRSSVLPFDHDRRMVSALLRHTSGRLTLVTKGAPESVFDRCVDVPDAARSALAAEFAAGNRVVAVAKRIASDDHAVVVEDENDLHLVGMLVFFDPPKHDAAEALRRLADLGITVKVVTGDNATVAMKVCADLGLEGTTALTGVDLDRMDDDALETAIARTTVFARVSPEHKARIVRLQRRNGQGVAFLGDGVNDALALHEADVGISVDLATDVAKDAADVILLAKDLNVLANGVTEGRRIFANTIKYVLMGTSSNFGNMFSAAVASTFLTFLPMLPSQILLNNLLYDTGQLTIPTDNVDAEELRRPALWDLGFIRRFMLTFGALSSIFDFATFAVMLRLFHSTPTQFRTGWFVESLSTQALVIFAIRTRRVPFFRSHPSLPLTLATLAVVAVGVALPSTPLAHRLGFQPLPAVFLATLVGMTFAYLALIEIGKRAFYRAASSRRA